MIFSDGQTFYDGAWDQEECFKTKWFQLFAGWKTIFDAETKLFSISGKTGRAELQHPKTKRVYVSSGNGKEGR